jgi:hypothetical protein
MHIDDSQIPFTPVWEGELETGGATFAVRGVARPRASIGQPTYWPLQPPAPPQAVGVTAAAATVTHQYGLVRFPFTLRPGQGNRVRRADFSVSLYPSGGGLRPTVYFAYPATKAVVREGEVTAKLGPDLKFAGAEASLASVAGTIKLKRPAAAVTLSGIGESDVQWTFQERGQHLLLGSLVAYVALALPPDVTAARAVAQLLVGSNTPLGRLLGRLPHEAAARVSWVLA